jgi:hypothetical protein
MEPALRCRRLRKLNHPRCAKTAHEETQPSPRQVPPVSRGQRELGPRIASLRRPWP